MRVVVSARSTVVLTEGLPGRDGAAGAARNGHPGRPGAGSLGYRVSISPAQRRHSVLRLIDFLALPPVARGAPRVVARADQLEGEVRWAHVFESREIRDAIRGGEVLLTTGIELTRMGDQIDGLVRDLARQGVVAFGLELGSVHRQSPPALVAACDRHALPLIAFARRVRFVEISQAVAELRLSAEVTRLRRAVDIQARLRETVQEGLGAAALVATAAEALDAQVLLEWADGSSLSSAGEEGLDA